MNREKIRTAIWLFPAILVATLLQNYFDINEIFSGGNLALYVYEGPIVYKIGKDIIYLCIMFSLFLYAKKSNKKLIKEFSLLMIILILITFFISILFNGIFLALVGGRWILPFILFLLMGGWAVAINKSYVSWWLFIGLVICFGAQCYQLFNMPPVFGEIFPGISARTPGIFLAPNSTAFFACSSAAYAMTINSNDWKVSFCAVMLALAISLLAQSGVGIVVSVILLVWQTRTRHTLLFAILSLSVGFMIFLNLDIITSREDYLELSGGGRIDVLFSIAESSATSLTNFGIFTNTANLQSDNPESKTAADSLVASWIGNFGILAIPMFFLTLCFIRFNMGKVNWIIAMPSVIVFLLFSATTIVFEAFPMNIYIAMGIWAGAINPLKDNYYKS